MVMQVRYILLFMFRIKISFVLLTQMSTPNLISFNLQGKRPCHRIPLKSSIMVEYLFHKKGPHLKGANQCASLKDILNVLSPMYHFHMGQIWSTTWLKAKIKERN